MISRGFFDGVFFQGTTKMFAVGWRLRTPRSFDMPWSLLFLQSFGLRPLCVLAPLFKHGSKLNGEVILLYVYTNDMGREQLLVVE